MKLILDKNQLGRHPEQFLREAGYGFIRDRRSGQESFVRRLGGHFYPRLHMYIERQGERISLNLHLDQKEASYPGAHAHNAEYEGPIVEGEMRRIKGLIGGGPQPGSDAQNEEELSERIGEGLELPTEVKPRKKSWWNFFSS